MINITQNANTIEVEGNIKSIEDSEQIRMAVDNIIKKYDSIVINIKGFTITSSVIGYLMKLVNEGKKIHINVKNESLYTLLDDLHLIDVFGVKLI